jgi:heme A synthase
MKKRFCFYAWSVLIFNLAVIQWGALVRASGSGAGCGQHWPLCNGQIIPTISLNATIIEFSHRLTSGIALISVVVLAIWAFRAFPPRYKVRGCALLALTATITEAAIGAGLVLLRLVAQNDSLARGIWLAGHLMRQSARLPVLPRLNVILTVSIAGFLAAGILGTFAALGDTLAATKSLTEGMRADFSAVSNIFVRVRILHPIVAGAFGVWLLVVAYQVIDSEQADAAVKRLARAIAILVFTQIALGIAGILLLTPIWLQLLHLLGADLLWIACVLLASELLPGMHNRSMNPRPAAIAVA